MIVRGIPALALVLAASTLFVLATAGVAHACPVCFDARETQRAAFLGTTIFLSLLPLGMIGGLALFLFRRSRARSEGDGEPT